MAERGASRAEIEQAIAAMQAGKTPTEAESAAQKKPIVQPQAAAAPARNTAAHSDTVIIPTSRPRYTSAERRAMLEEVQRRQAEREAERQKLAQEEESHFRTYRDREYGTNPPPRAAKSLADKPQPDATRTIRTSKPAADATRTVQVPQSELCAAAQKAAPAPQPVQTVQTVQTTQQFIPESAQAPQLVPQTQPKPAVPAPEAAPKRRGPVGMPRTYAEAEAALNERIRADHIWLSNPVLVRGLGMAPVIGAALDGQRALMLCIAALILVTFTRVLAVAVWPPDEKPFPPGGVLLFRRASLHSHVHFALLAVRHRSVAAGYLPAHHGRGACHRQAHGVCRPGTR